jgi:hypothetical protein
MSLCFAVHSIPPEPLQTRMAGKGQSSTSRIAVAHRLVVKILANDFTASKSMRFRASDRGLNIPIGISRSLA